MDNLKGKTIKQYYFEIDNGTIVITAIIERETKMTEWWGHLMDYGAMKFLVAGVHLKHRTWQETAQYMVREFYDDIVDTAIDDDVTEYMGGYSDEAMHGEIKRLVKSYNKKLAELAEANGN